VFLISYTIEIRENPEYKPFSSIYKVWLFKDHYTRCSYAVITYMRMEAADRRVRSGVQCALKAAS